MAELYLHVHVIAPVVYGVETAYYVYLAVFAFIVSNLVGNISSLVRTKTSIHEDTCLEPELNVKLCSTCDRNVPPR